MDYAYVRKDAETLTDSEVLAVAHELAMLLVLYVREINPGSDIMDASSLPASKTSLTTALRLAVATEPRDSFREMYIEAGNALAQFQEGVGSRIEIGPASRKSWRFSLSPGGETAAKIEIALAGVAADSIRISSALAESQRIAEKRFAWGGGSAPFSEDGTYRWHGHYAAD